MGDDAIRVERIGSRAELEDFARLPFQIYREREAWWPPDVQNEIELLSGRSPLSGHLQLAPFRVRRGARTVARVTAVVNSRYNRHWNEALGQLVHFEALRDEEEATLAMLDAAGNWLAEHGMKAARSGFAAFLDYPYAIDNYDALPSFLLRGNPDYYHRYFKNAGFFTEKGQCDYTAPLTPAILERYRGALEGALAAGVGIKSWREFGFMAAVDVWAEITNAAFARHWGWNPVSREEVRPMLAAMFNSPAADLSMLAQVNGATVGAVFCVHDMSPGLVNLRAGARLSPERGGGTRGALINIGVLESARGRGIALAMAARSFLAMAARGMRYAGYTLVLDDNWASRRTAERLGARVTGSFVTYRRDF